MTRFLFASVCSLALFGTAATSAPVLWNTGSGGNGHFYEMIGDDGSEQSLDFDDALAAAASMTFAGRTGHLATITSAEEQAFINSQFLEPFGYYIGASDADDEGEWFWVAGPEAGLKIGSETTSGFSAVSYSNWAPFEPNDFGTGEDYASGNFNSVPGQWNDIPSFENAYLVEYSRDGGVNPIPLPPAAGLMLLGLGGLGLLRRKR